MARHVKKGDTVVVIAGEDKNKVGQVLRINPKSGKVLVQGINRVYRHLKPSRQHPRGGRIQKEMPISLSNVLPVDPKTNKGTRVHFRVNSDGSKDRVSAGSQTSLGSVKKVK